MQVVHIPPLEAIKLESDWNKEVILVRLGNSTSLIHYYCNRYREKTIQGSQTKLS